jgi:hypothetical protein
LINIKDLERDSDPYFRITDPDPGGQIITDPSDPDPQHCPGPILIETKTEKAEYFVFFILCELVATLLAGQMVEEAEERHDGVTRLHLLHHRATRLSLAVQQTRLGSHNKL